MFTTIIKHRASIKEDQSAIDPLKNSQYVDDLQSTKGLVAQYWIAPNIFAGACFYESATNNIIAGWFIPY